MTCRDVRRLLTSEGGSGPSGADREALDRHLKVCDRCATAAKVARLSSVLLAALRDEVQPGPTFYERLRLRMASAAATEAEATLIQLWGFARRLVPALALGVFLFAGMTISVGMSQSSRQTQVRQARDLYAFSLEEVNLPGAVGPPNQDQMLAFVLMQDEKRGALPGKQDRSDGQHTR